MNKTQITRIIFLILSIITAVIIFMFSSENGEKSGNTSRNVIKNIIEIIPSTKNLSNEEKENIIENSQLLVRKLAHFSIYAILSFNIAGYIGTYNIENKKQIILALIICIIYSISDEINQNFLEGRACSIIDVGIDTCGSTFGILIMKIGRKIINKKDKKNNQTKNNTKVKNKTK